MMDVVIYRWGHTYNISLDILADKIVSQWNGVGHSVGGTDQYQTV